MSYHFLGLFHDIGVSGLRLGLPFVFAVWGAWVSARVRVFNISLEGIMLSGAFTYSLTWLALSYSGGISPNTTFLCSVVAALLIGALWGLLFGWLVCSMRFEQIVTGVAINMVMLGVVEYAHTRWLEHLADTHDNRALAVGGLHGTVTGFTELYFLGSVALIGTLIIHAFYKYTRWGIRATSIGRGEHGESAAIQSGVPVTHVRIYSSLATGALTAFSGTTLVILAENYSRGMSAGRGFIALALAVTARGEIWGVCLAAIFFGMTQSPALTGFFVERLHFHVPTQIQSSFPYVTTLALLCVPAARAWLSKKAWTLSRKSKFAIQQVVTFL